ncbi:MAG TPA: hypothetical protein VGZ22_31100, partial [Isosphaeraceae bacterium]|nr:hypothetical protein [Isosphaeraceae bacterium]
MAKARCRRARWLARAGLGLAAALLSGCSTGAMGPLARWREAHDSSLTRGVNNVDDDDGRSMMARWLNPQKPKPPDPNGPSKLVMGPKGWNATKVAPNPDADAEFAAAEKLFQQGKLEEVETEFARIAKVRKDTPWGEQAQYYLAETQYQRGRYVRAHNSYEQLVASYPGTKYMEKVVAREYAIGQRWLSLYDPKTPEKDQIPWYGRFNGQRPLLDTFGHAVSALEHVQHNDPQGPLADDALLRVAD